MKHNRSVHRKGVFVAMGWMAAANAYALDWDHTDLNYGTEDPERQFLNIYLAQSDAPTPVYLFAHANGGSAYGFGQNSADLIVGAGYTLVSWASLITIASEEDILIGQADAQQVFDWLQDNATTYNLDPDRVIVGGRSRGSILSWEVAHSAHPSIEGVYFYNALPDGAWADLQAWNPVESVTADSPSMYLAFGPAPNDGDPHNPANLYPVIDRYEALDLGDQITLTDDMNADGLDPFTHFPSFVEQLSKTTTPDEDDDPASDDSAGCNSTALPATATWLLWWAPIALLRRSLPPADLPSPM